MRCWYGYLSATRCRLFAYGPADVTASQNPIISCLILTQTGLPFWYRLTQVVLENRLLNGCSRSSSSSLIHNSRRLNGLDKTILRRHTGDVNWTIPYMFITNATNSPTQRMWGIYTATCYATKLKMLIWYEISVPGRGRCRRRAVRWVQRELGQHRRDTKCRHQAQSHRRGHRAPPPVHHHPRPACRSSAPSPPAAHWTAPSDPPDHPAGPAHSHKHGTLQCCPRWVIKPRLQLAVALPHHFLQLTGLLRQILQLMLHVLQSHFSAVPGESSSPASSSP